MGANMKFNDLKSLNFLIFNQKERFILTIHDQLCPPGGLDCFEQMAYFLKPKLARKAGPIKWQGALNNKYPWSYLGHLLTRQKGAFFGLATAGLTKHLALFAGHFLGLWQTKNIC